MKKNEKFRLHYPNTRYFRWENMNPKSKITADCVVRAISKAMDRPYEEVYKELFECSLRTGHMLHSPENYDKYLREQGWVKQKQPVHSNKTKMSGKEFVRKFGKQYPRVIMHIGVHHLSCMVDGKVVDIWDCTDRKIGKWWIKC